MEAGSKIVRPRGGGAGGRFVGPVARRDGRVARATLSVSEFRFNVKQRDFVGEIWKAGCGSRFETFGRE
jgi:hypothetical protein